MKAQPHRQAEREGHVGRERAEMGQRIGRALERRVFPIDPRQQAEREDHRDDAEQRRMNASAPSREENQDRRARRRWRVRCAAGRSRQPSAHADPSVGDDRQSRATGVKSAGQDGRTDPRATRRRRLAGEMSCCATGVLRQDDRAGADLLDHIEAMRAEQSSGLPRRARDERSKQQARVHVETGKRLVQHQEIRVVQQRRREQHALPHAL